MGIDSDSLDEDNIPPDDSKVKAKVTDDRLIETRQAQRAILKGLGTIFDDESEEDSQDIP